MILKGHNALWNGMFQASGHILETLTDMAKVTINH